MIRIDYKKCTACGACAQKCPKKCIELQPDGNGFIYPSINEAECINCDLCSKTCLISSDVAIPEITKAYACASADGDMLIQSTSGGAFGAIATYVLKMGGVVYGCAYTDHLQATHIRVDSIDDLNRLFGSKYVQSNTRNTFKDCENDLKAGRFVLYSGVPCQIAGLKKLLGKQYNNLITVDIICHGVASQKYFDKFIDYLERSEEATCIDYKFRSKKNAGWSAAGIASFKDANGKAFDKKQFYFSNYYYFHYYYGCSVYRESCYSCKYANMSREGDFTLGDFWGVEGLDIPFSTQNGCSLVLVNSSAAANLLDKLEINKHEVDQVVAVKHNKQLSSPSAPLFDRAELLREFREESAETMQNNFKKQYKKAILIGRVKYMVPSRLKQILLKIRYRK